MSDAYDDDLGEGAEWLELNEENQRLRAENERLREWKSLHSRITAPDEPNWFEEACSQKARADRLERAVQAVRALPYHTAWIGGGFVVRKFDIDAALGGEQDE